MMADFAWAAAAAGVGLSPNMLRETARRNTIECRFIVSRVLRSISPVSLAARHPASNQKSGSWERGAPPAPPPPPRRGGAAAPRPPPPPAGGPPPAAGGGGGGGGGGGPPCREAAPA